MASCQGRTLGMYVSKHCMLPKVRCAQEHGAARDSLACYGADLVHQGTADMGATYLYRPALKVECVSTAGQVLESNLHGTG